VVKLLGRSTERVEAENLSQDSLDFALCIASFILYNYQSVAYHLGLMLSCITSIASYEIASSVLNFASDKNLSPLTDKVQMFVEAKKLMTQLNSFNKYLVLWIFSTQMIYLSLNFGKVLERTFWPDQTFLLFSTGLCIVTFYIAAETYEIVCGNKFNKLFRFNKYIF